MRGRQPKQRSVVCFIDIEDVVPKDDPIRPIKELAGTSLKQLSRIFDRMYGKTGRPSIPPERLLKGMLLIALYSVRSEAEFCRQLRYNLLFRWFLDMDLVEEPFDHCAFSDNRQRLIDHDVAGKFFRAVVGDAQAEGLMSSEHFSVDGTLIEAWASMKSFRPKDGDDDNDSNGWSDFRGKKRRNDTHESRTDPEAKLYRKGRGKEAKLAFMGHALMENRNGLLVNIVVTEANGHAERDAALEMIDESVTASHATVGADAGYDAKDFVTGCRDRGVTPHVAQKKHSAIDGRTTHHAGYRVSQQIRKRIEQIFGWKKVVGGMRKTRFKGRERNQLLAHVAGAAYNLLRIAKLKQAFA